MEAVNGDYSYHSLEIVFFVKWQNAIILAHSIRDCKALPVLVKHCTLAVAQCIVIGPVCLFVAGCVCLCVAGSVGEGSDHLQLIKFWPSHAHRKGVCSGAKIFGSALLQPERSVCVSLSTFFFHFILQSLLYEDPSRWSFLFNQYAFLTRLRQHQLETVCCMSVTFAKEGYAFNPLSVCLWTG